MTQKRTKRAVQNPQGPNLEAGFKASKQRIQKKNIEKKEYDF